MKRLLFIAFIICFTKAGYSQANYFNVLNLEYNHKSAQSIAQLDSTYVVCGHVTDSINNWKHYICFYTLDQRGKIIDSKHFNGADSATYYPLKMLYHNKMFYVGGENTFSDTLGTPIFIFFAAFTEDFELKWIKYYKDNNGGGALDFKLTEDKGFILTGSHFKKGNAHSQLMLLKIDSLGNEQWIKRIGWGGSSEGGYSVQQLFDKGYIASGYKEGLVPPDSAFNNWDANLYLIRTDSVGNLLWEKSIGTSYEERMAFIKQLADGNLLLSGSIGKMEPLIGNVGYIAKLNSDGEIMWEKKYDFGYHTYFTQEMIEDEAQNLVVVGNTINDFTGRENKAFLIKFDHLGRLLWKRDYFKDSTNDNYLRSLQATPDKGFLMYGYVFDSLSIPRAWVIKTDCFGYDSVTYYFKDSICNLEDCKRYEHDFDLMVNQDSLDLNNGELLFANATLNENASLTWDFGDGNSLKDELTIAYQYQDAGTYKLQLVFEKGMCQLSKSKQIHIQKPYLEVNFALYPNPNDGNFTILHYFDQQVDLSITNALGQEVFRKEELSKQAHINLFLASGLYFVSLTHEGKAYQQKMVVK